jgi:hypothetical protein
VRSVIREIGRGGRGAQVGDDGGTERGIGVSALPEKGIGYRPFLTHGSL